MNKVLIIVSLFICFCMLISGCNQPERYTREEWEAIMASETSRITPTTKSTDFVSTTSSTTHHITTTKPPKKYSFDDAVNKIQKTPWKMDGEIITIEGRLYAETFLGTRCYLLGEKFQPTSNSDLFDRHYKDCDIFFIDESNIFNDISLYNGHIVLITGKVSVKATRADRVEMAIVADNIEPK